MFIFSKDKEKIQKKINLIIYLRQVTDRNGPTKVGMINDVQYGPHFCILAH